MGAPRRATARNTNPTGLVGVAPPGPLRTDWVANPPKPVWSVPLGGGYSSFAATGNHLYTQDRKDGAEHVCATSAM